MRPILSTLEETPPTKLIDIVIVPPHEDDAISDEGSEDEDGGPNGPNHVWFRMMSQQVELETTIPTTQTTK